MAQAGFTIDIHYSDGSASDERAWWKRLFGQPPLSVRAESTGVSFETRDHAMHAARQLVGTLSDADSETFIAVIERAGPRGEVVGGYYAVSGEEG